MATSVPPDDEPLVTRCLGSPRDICYKKCQCWRCGIIRRCTPSFDFYVESEDAQRRLCCEKCLLRENFLILGDTHV